jgi:hypothetical protein
MSGKNPYNDVGRGLHIFNYDNDSDTGINFWSGSSESSSLYQIATFGAGATGEVIFNPEGLARDFRVKSGDDSHALFVNAANNQIYLGGSTAPTATGFLNLGGIKFSNGSAGGGKFLSWDNEGGTGSQSLIGYWYDGSSYRNRFRMAGDTGITTVNGSGDDVDFRVSSDTDANMLFVDAGNNTLSVGTNSPPTAHAVNNPTMNIARAVQIENFVHGNVENIYNSGNGRVFTVATSTNGQAAMLQITAANHNGVIEQCFYLRNDGGTWANIPGPVATSGTPPTITVVLNAGGTATFTVLGAGANPNYYNQGYLLYKTSKTLVTLTT